MPLLVNQYTDYPVDNPNEPISEPTAEKPKESKNISKYIYVAIGVLALVIIGLVILSTSKSLEIDDTVNDNSGGSDNPDVSGDTNKTSAVGKNETSNPAADISKNGICDPQENCFDNPEVCKCKADEYCSDKKECLKPECGDLFCEIGGGESEATCCIDCKCTIPGQMCNSETKACEEAKMNLTSERAIEIIKSYFSAQGVELNLTESLGVFEYNQTMVLRIKVQRADEPYSRQYAVNENEDVIDLHTM